MIPLMEGEGEVLDLVQADQVHASDILFTPPSEFSEEQACAWLAEQSGDRPSIRACAAAWTWPKSRAERFLSRIDAETALPNPETPRETTTVSQVDDVIARTKQTATAAATTIENFDWFGDDVVIWDQPATAVYFNNQKQIVIRQEAKSGDEDEDMFVRIDVDRLETVIRRIRQLVAELG